MLPTNVHVATKRKQHAVRLRKVDLGAIACVQKGEFAGRAKRYADSNILVFGALRIKGSRVVVKRLWDKKPGAKQDQFIVPTS